MKVQYDVEDTGELMVLDESGRLVVLHPSYWQIKTVPENKRVVTIYPTSPRIDIPEKLFGKLFHGIRRYHHEGAKKPGLEGYDQPYAQRLKGAIESAESELVSILKGANPKLFDTYLWVKQLATGTI